MTPGIMIRIKANILMNVNETCVRVAKDTLQQFTATTNARKKDLNYRLTHKLIDLLRY